MIVAHFVPTWMVYHQTEQESVKTFQTCEGRQNRQKQSILKSKVLIIPWWFFIWNSRIILRKNRWGKPSVWGKFGEAHATCPTIRGISELSSSSWIQLCFSDAFKLSRHILKARAAASGRWAREATQAKLYKAMASSSHCQGPHEWRDLHMSTFQVFESRFLGGKE